MPDTDLLRVVVVRKGKVKAAEFRLRDGEIGLSLFRNADSPGAQAILAAVHAAGKQGELGIAEIPEVVFHQLGLRLVRTPGGTPDPEVNAVHIEARPSRWCRLKLWLHGRPVHVWFNDQITPQLAAAAKLIE